MGLAERADVIVDFTNVPLGNHVLAQRRTRRAVRRRRARRGLRPRRPRDDRSDHAVPRRARDRDRRLDPAPVPPAARDHAAARGDGHAAAGADREGGRGLRRGRRAELEGPVEALLGTVDGRRVGRAQVDGSGDREPRTSARPRSGRSTTPPPTPTRCTSTRSPSRSSTAKRLVLDGGRGRPADPARRRPHPARAEGDRLQGHRHRLPRPGHPRQGPVQHPRPVRLALPHRRARGQRDDAPLPHRTARSPASPPCPRCHSRPPAKQPAKQRRTAASSRANTITSEQTNCKPPHQMPPVQPGRRATARLRFHRAACQRCRRQVPKRAQLVSV